MGKVSGSAQTHEMQWTQDDSKSKMQGHFGLDETFVKKNKKNKKTIVDTGYEEISPYLHIHFHK